MLFFCVLSSTASVGRLSVIFVETSRKHRRQQWRVNFLPTNFNEKKFTIYYSLQLLGSMLSTNTTKIFIIKVFFPISKKQMVMSQPTQNTVLKSLKWSVIQKDDDGIRLLLGIDDDNLLS